MIPVEKVIALLDKNKALLQKLDGHDLAGFAIIYPPDGEPTEVIDLASRSDAKSFFEAMMNKLKSGLETSQLGGVLMPPGLGTRR